MSNPLADHFRIPEEIAKVGALDGLSASEGFFRIGERATAFGKICGADPPATVEEELPDVSAQIRSEDGSCLLPFDLAQVVENFWHERYAEVLFPGGGPQNRKGIVRSLYYLLRPLLPVTVRKRLQKAALRGWDEIAFPKWPVDFSVEEIFDVVLRSLLEQRNGEPIPFIWFWPEGHSACAIITHDIETAAGRDFCGALMDIDEAHGFQSSFQAVPEQRYEVPLSFIRGIQKRGHEANLHGLNHDGHLFSEREEFLRRAEKINRYAEEYGAWGFRSPVLYRKIPWMQDLRFQYDLTIPNVANMDPQRGGCCTVMPYFIGDLLELPLTTIQDYGLFHFLGDYSTALWETQVERIVARNGLASFNIHPDYIIEKAARETYCHLLERLVCLREQQGVWTPTPGEVNLWWRLRRDMRLSFDEGSWKIQGNGAKKARLAFVRLADSEVRYELASDEPF